MRPIASYTKRLRRLILSLASPVTRELHTRRLESLESGWEHASRARDRVFVNRVLQRYIAHYERVPVLPPCPRSRR
jgi:hypothetical protein